MESRNENLEVVEGAGARELRVSGTRWLRKGVESARSAIAAQIDSAYPYPLGHAAVCER
jgi:hypothetical protein